MDIGGSPTNNFSKFYQSGALSFEIFSNGKKTNHKLWVFY